MFHQGEKHVKKKATEYPVDKNEHDARVQSNTK